MKDITFRFTIQKVGTSKGIIINSYFCKLYGLDIGDEGECILRLDEK